MVLLVAAKLITVFVVPYAYKFAVDALEPGKGTIIVIPVLMIVAYGLGRATVDAFQNMRDAIFVAVGQNALRSVATEVFIHLHKLALRFHVERRTGGLSRVIERGVKSTEFLLRFSLFNVIPTMIEICLVTAVMFINFDWRFAAVTLVSVEPLYLLHLLGDRVAAQVPPRDEQAGYRGEYQGRGQPVELRDGQIFLATRSTRRGAMTGRCIAI